MAIEADKTESWWQKLGKSIAEHTLRWAVLGALGLLSAFIRGNWHAFWCAIKPWLGLAQCHIY
jgi:hypothetical protein